MRPILVTLAALLALVCGCPIPFYTCPDPVLLEVGAGRHSLSGPGLSGEVEPLGADIDPGRQSVTLRFRSQGAVYEARYKLAPISERVLFLEVSLVGKTPTAKQQCEAGQAAGPVVDAVALRRDGKTVAWGHAARWSQDRGQPPRACGAVFEAPRAQGTPDGVGVALGDYDMRLTFEPNAGVRPGDELEITVLGGLEQPYDVVLYGSIGRSASGYLRVAEGRRGSARVRVPSTPGSE
jgi:hypothetical protein